MPGGTTGAVDGLPPLQSSVSFPEPVLLAEAVGVLVAGYLAAKLLSGLLTALADRLATDRFRVTLLIPVAKFVVYGGALYVVARLLFELSTAQLVAFSGLLGAALGLGVKDLLADIVGGLVLVAERPYRIGDKVAIGDHYGEVTDIGIRSTRLITPTDTLVTVPNYLFFDESIANANAGAAEMLVVVEFFIATDADVATARRIVEDALITSQYVYVTDDRPVSVLVEDDLHHRTIRGKAYVNDLRNEFAFKSDVTERTLEAFEKHGIESPQVPAGVDGETAR
jgi:small-conductance mechanosensitive channel